ncbi:MAG: PEP-CTERM sorting domain-containing protein [Planctomycetia bacterium]|nr:PEP-CTERM sorting domain-containing protein [Planctomycetia bacterium]
MYRKFTAFIMATATALSVTVAQAAPLPTDQVQWQYNWTPGTPSVSSNNSPVGVVTFTNELPTFATGSSDIVATNLRVASTLPATTPNVLTTNGAYSMGLTISMFENGTLHTGSHTFTGKLSGTFSSEASNVKNSFDPGSGSFVVFQLGSYDFTVRMDAYTPPGPPSAVQTGSISAHVEVSLRDTPPVVTETPEPGTMVLGGLALTCIGGVAWRKRRKVEAAA